MIEIETKYTLDIYKEYFWFSLFRGRYYRYGKATFPFFTALMAILSIISLFWIQSTLSIIISLSGVIICALFYMMAFTRPKKYVKQSPALFQTAVLFVFNEDSFSTLQTGDIASGTGITKYEALHRIYETQNTFYLYLTPMQALLLTKHDFTKGSPMELRELLKSKIPAKKYVICK